MAGSITSLCLYASFSKIIDYLQVFQEFCHLLVFIVVAPFLYVCSFMSSSQDFAPLFISSEGMNVINSAGGNFGLPKERVGCRSIEALRAKIEVFGHCFAREFILLNQSFSRESDFRICSHQKKYIFTLSLPIFIWIWNIS